ncbi:GNAT family N-acetyltransferase [Desulfatitalea alkaliphila]|uniref:GNAT family N-acetyltransferase n=1 Tax=Desulfatitalea alkaliphila TaxID=2929485 RepID=A0AA41R6J5_9BACT|nr:GNAT family N-acetyltransferase [Desulfatitalea alkaliphila]MCJ8502100.1 GNAT family N-acetyltransferase [Desulfatitalea alkaliphila]
MNYEIRPYQTGDETGILDLYRQIYPQPRTLAQWAWEYRDTAAGPSVIYVICKDKEIIGHYAILPLPAFCNGKKIYLGKAEGAMIKPQERFVAVRKGFFKELVNRGRTDAFNRGIPVIFGFTSKPRDFVMAGFQEAGKLYALQQDLRLKYKTKVWLKNKLGKSNDLLEASFLDKVCSTIKLRKEIANQQIETTTGPMMPADAAKIAAEIPTQGVIDVERSRDYLEWRYQHNPFAQAFFIAARCEGKLLGWMAVSVDGGDHGTGYILDTCIEGGSSDVVLYALYQRAMSHFKAKNVSYVNCWRSEHPKDAGIMDHYIRWGLRKRVHVINFVLHIDDQQVDPSFVMDIKNWSISMALTEGRMG